MIDLTSSLVLDVFSASYMQARQRFLRQLNNFPQDLLQIRQVFEHPLTGPENEMLACDLVCLSQSTTPGKLVVLMSATHGVEGFCGSAIQCDILPLLEPVLRQQPELGIIILHAFNPWGFAWLRRYDHEGIDLNRNFVDFTKPLPVNSEYAVLHQALLNSEDLMYANQLEEWQQQLGDDKFTEIITRGQYEFANGFFFGGKKASWSRMVLEEVTNLPWVSNAELIAVIDLHTGLGPYGYGELINDHLPESNGFHWVNQWYGHNAQSAVLGHSASAVKVGLVDFHWHEVIGDRGCFVTLEFGTYAFPLLMESLKTEQRYYNNNPDRNITNPDVIALRDFFYPQEDSWKQQILFRGRQVLSLALTGVIN